MKDTIMLSPTAAALGIAVMVVNPIHVTDHASKVFARHTSAAEKPLTLAANVASKANLPIDPPAAPGSPTLSGGIMFVSPPAGSISSALGGGIMRVSPPIAFGAPELHVYPVMRAHPQPITPLLPSTPVRDPRPESPDGTPSLKGSQS
jgi:hypothetical protein